MERISTSVLRLASALVLLLATGCGSPKGEAIVIFGEGESAAVQGHVEFIVEPMTGNLRPNFWKPGTLFLFRVANDRLGVEAKPGEVYRVAAPESNVSSPGGLRGSGRGAELERVGTFDVALTDEELGARYVGGSGGGASGGAWPALVMAALVVLLISGLVFLFRAWTPGRPPPASPGSAPGPD